MRTVSFARKLPMENSTATLAPFLFYWYFEEIVQFWQVKSHRCKPVSNRRVSELRGEHARVQLRDVQAWFLPKP